MEERTTLGPQMRKRFFAAFRMRLQRRLPFFQRASGLRLSRAEMYAFSVSRLELRLLVGVMQHSDEFYLEIGWGHGPAKSWYTGFFKDPLPADMAMRLPDLWVHSTVSATWYFGPRLQAQPWNFVFSSLEEAVDDAVEKLASHGLSFLGRMVELNAPELREEYRQIVGR